MTPPTSSSLRLVQLGGVLTKGGTVALGILQTALVLRILSPEEFGIIGIVVSLGSLVGVSQHVGIVDAAIREIAATEDPRRRAHVFWISLWFRLLVTVPLSLLLALAAGWIGQSIYPFPDVPYLVRLTSVILILQGIQGVVGGAYTGKRAFRSLYLAQLFMAVVNIPIFVFLTDARGVGGYFEAVILSTGAFILLLSFSLRHALGGSLAHPSRTDARQVFRDILHTGVWTYIARILSVLWQRLPLLLLGRWATPDVVGLFNVALTFGSKLVILAAAIGEVNLAFLTAAFTKSAETFRSLARRTVTDIGAAVLLGASVLALFADVLLSVFAGRAYVFATDVTILVTWAYAAFAFVDIATNTLFVPARRAHDRALVFAVLTAVTFGFLFFFRQTPLLGAGIATLVGGLSAVVTAQFLTRRLSFHLLSARLLFGTLCAGMVTLLSVFHAPLALRITVAAVAAVLGCVILLPRLRALRGRLSSSSPHATT